MYELKLRRLPSLDTILQLASSQTDVREHALRYFMDNFDKSFSNIWKGGVYHQRPFIPAVNYTGESVLGTASDVYTEETCAILGVNVIPSTSFFYKFACRKLKLTQKPDVTKVVAILRERPPLDAVRADQWFSYLSATVGSKPLMRLVLSQVDQGHRACRLLQFTAQ